VGEWPSPLRPSTAAQPSYSEAAPPFYNSCGIYIELKSKISSKEGKKKKRRRRKGWFRIIGFKVYFVYG